jgi:hypothetical protein
LDVAEELAHRLQEDIPAPLKVYKPHKVGQNTNMKGIQKVGLHLGNIYRTAYSWLDSAADTHS